MGYAANAVRRAGCWQHAGDLPEVLHSSGSYLESAVVVAEVWVMLLAHPAQFLPHDDEQGAAVFDDLSGQPKATSDLPDGTMSAVVSYGSDVWMRNSAGWAGQAWRRARPIW